MIFLFKGCSFSKGWFFWFHVNFLGSTYCKHHERPICMCWICNGCHVLSPLAGVTFSEGRLPREIRQDTNHSNDIGCLISFTWPRWQHHHGFRTPGFKGVKFEANKNAYPWYYTCLTTMKDRKIISVKKTLGSLYLRLSTLPGIRDWDSLWPRNNKGHNDFNTFHCQTI